MNLVYKKEKKIQWLPRNKKKGSKSVKMRDQASFLCTLCGTLWNEIDTVCDKHSDCVGVVIKMQNFC